MNVDLVTLRVSNMRVRELDLMTACGFACLLSSDVQVDGWH